MLPRLGKDPSVFPATSAALEEPNGLLACGGDLSAPRLLQAYRLGVFPWYEAGQPILWWTPQPRAVFFPAQVRCNRSLLRFMRKTAWQVVLNRNFCAVIAACAAPRGGRPGTWITPDMHRAYVELHQLGFAHSVEVYDGEQLLGGLYGVALGRVFFGESMFSRASNASKVALVVLNRFLHQHGFELFDCQVESAHLTQLGAQCLPRNEFESILRKAINEQTLTTMQSIWHSASNRVVGQDGHIHD